MNDNPHKFCPFCGKTSALVEYKDPDSPVRLVMCDPPKGGCGAMAPAESWDRRRGAPLELLINPNVPKKVQAAPDPETKA